MSTSETDSNPSPPTAHVPPTRRGHVPEVASSRLAAVAFVTSFPGLIVPLVNVASVIMGIVALRRIKRSEIRVQGGAFAIAAISLGVFGFVPQLAIAWFIWMITQTVSQARTFQFPPQVTAIHQQVILHATETGRYPDHVAEFMVSDRMPSVHKMVIGTWQAGRAGLTTIGSFDVVDYDGSEKSKARLQQAIDDFIEIPLNKDFYNFGHCWFVRLPKHFNSDELVAAWSLDGPQMQLVFDSGSTTTCSDEDHWDEIWATDAAARAALGIEKMNFKPGYAFE